MPSSTSLPHRCSAFDCQTRPILWLCALCCSWALIKTLAGGLNAGGVAVCKPQNGFALRHSYNTTNRAVPPLAGNKTATPVAAVLPPLAVCICPRETICARNWYSLVFLVLARGSAYADYPLYIALFVSKAHNLRKWASKTIIREFIDISDTHKLHIFAGAVVSFEVVSHSFWHILRWAVNNEMHLLFSTTTGITGAVTLCLTPLIAWPMLFQRCRISIRYELRKALHYLSVFWAISLCFHAPATHIAFLIGIPLSIYVADWVYGTLFTLHHLQTLHMTRKGSFVEVSWENPPGFVNPGAGYVYICLPWVSKYEWHVFSIVASPTKPKHSSVVMACIGDWTKTVHTMLARPSNRPGWIYGPFPSEFSDAHNFDNLCVAATGIGITPVVSALVTLRQTRRVNVIWMVRDAELVEFYLESRCFAENAFTLIFYTGKPELLRIKRAWVTPWIKIISGRPRLGDIVPAIIRAAEDGAPLPDSLISQAAIMERRLFDRDSYALFRQDFDRYEQTYNKEEMYQRALDCSTRLVPPAHDISMSSKDLNRLARQSHGINHKEQPANSLHPGKVDGHERKQEESKEWRGRSDAAPVSKVMTVPNSAVHMLPPPSQGSSVHSQSAMVSKKGLIRFITDCVCQSEEAKCVVPRIVDSVFAKCAPLGHTLLAPIQFYRALERFRTIGPDLEAGNNAPVSGLRGKARWVKKAKEMMLMQGVIKDWQEDTCVLRRARSGRISAMRRLDVRKSVCVCVFSVCSLLCVNVC